MKVYVDELPKSCDECELTYQEHSWADIRCKLTGQYCAQSKSECPLQSLSDHTKQVRKEVVQEIRNFLNRQEEIVKTIYYNSYQMSGLEVIEETIELLERIQRK